MRKLLILMLASPMCWGQSTDPGRWVTITGSQRSGEFTQVDMQSLRIVTPLGYRHVDVRFHGQGEFTATHLLIDCDNENSVAHDLSLEGQTQGAIEQFARILGGTNGSQASHKQIVGWLCNLPGSKLRTATSDQNGDLEAAAEAVWDAEWRNAQKKQQELAQQRREQKERARAAAEAAAEEQRQAELQRQQVERMTAMEEERAEQEQKNYDSCVAGLTTPPPPPPAGTLVRTMVVVDGIPVLYPPRNSQIPITDHIVRCTSTAYQKALQNPDVQSAITKEKQDEAAAEAAAQKRIAMEQCVRRQQAQGGLLLGSMFAKAACH
jgi:hypothetical protein